MFVQPKSRITPSQLYNALKFQYALVHSPCFSNLPSSQSPLRVASLGYVYPWLYSGRRSFRTGEMSGWSCARNVIAHMMYIAAAESTRVDRQMLLSRC